MSTRGTHKPNSHRARERKAQRRQAHARGERQATSTPVFAQTELTERSKPPKREPRNQGPSGGEKHRLKHRRRTR